jgi:cell division protease FtsH
LTILLLLMMGMWVWRSAQEEPAMPGVDYSTLYGWAEDGKVESVTIRGQSVQGKLKTSEDVDGKKIEQFQTTTPPGDDALLDKLREHDVRIRVASEQQPFAVQLVLTLLPWVLIIGVWIFLSRRVQRMMGGGAGPFGGMLKGRSHKFDKTESVEVTFEDVAGLKSAKQDLQEIVEFLREPERFRRLGGKVPRGVLLVGPPGTGKTLLARAVAGESGVAFYSISASEFIEMFVGVGAARVRDLFSEAKKNAPAIIFIDEIDAVGRSRGAGLGGGHDEREQTLNQLLSEMDGFNRNDLTIVLAATNRPDVLDPALLRPGRFDRRVVVDRPELPARLAILKVHTKEMPLGESVDLQRIAASTPGFSGADLANLVNEAALGATRRGAEAIERDDFNAAQDKIVLGDPREAKLDPDEKNRVAIHEAGHALNARYSDEAEPLHRVSIIPRGMALGVTQQTPAGDRHIMTQKQLESRLRVLMGGYAAERVILGDTSTGAENDLKQATELASKMVAHWGMSEKFGPVYYEHHAEHPFLGQRIAADTAASDATVHAIEGESRRILTEALDQAQQCIREHRERFDKLVEALLENETLEREELMEIFPDLDASCPPEAARSRIG